MYVWYNYIMVPHSVALKNEILKLWGKSIELQKNNNHPEWGDLDSKRQIWHEVTYVTCSY